MPALRQREQTLRAELQAIADQTNDRAAFLRLAAPLTAFLARLRSAAETLSVTERQRIVRLLVKDVLVGEDTITIRHSIPIPSGPPQNGGSQPEGPNYLLCKGRDNRPLRSSCIPRFNAAIFPLHRRLQPAFHIEHDPAAVGMFPQCLKEQLMWNRVEGSHDTLPIISTFRSE